MNECIITVFVEQPLALPGLLKSDIKSKGHIPRFNYLGVLAYQRLSMNMLNNFLNYSVSNNSVCRAAPGYAKSSHHCVV